ncbi:unnamed protein product [Leptidea sinapis]|uniref:unspecific monooxygenase n=1 Tax=Leptidea sinapis TaxID=189913 RepID=A0A5E4PXH6_9NEOP|nr:unnamed protein product [Leptidea sinapis]
MELNTGTKQLAQFILDDWKLLLCLTILFALYFHYTSTFDFFEKKGIKFMKPTIIVGNIGSRILARTSFHAFQLEIYNNFKGHPYGGIFEGRRPVLYLIDPDIIKAVTIRDFDYFMDRLAFMSNAPKYISRSLLNLKGAEWKSVRSTITPSFSSSRLKHMLPLIQSCSDQMVKFLKQYENKDIEMKDIMGHFTLEVIGTCAFGIKSDALTDENAKFVKVAEKFNYIPAHKRFFLFFLLMFMPKMIRKNDFLQLMIDAAEKEKEMCENSNEKPHLDDDTIDAQSLLFLIAGYETSIARVDRVATKPYTLPGTSIKIDVGDTVSIPVYGIHMDPDHYPEPEEFKPDRFMKDGKVERPSHLFLAFGAGPRNCIGLRFAMFSAKLAMVSLLKNFKFTSCPKTEQPIQFHKSSMLLKAKTDNKDIEMQNKMGHFTLEVISTCAFGIKSDALTDENAKFVKVAERKNDFLQLMIDAAKKEKEKCKNSKEKPLWDDDTIYAQSLLFLIASYETSSTLLSFAIHTLAVQPEIQEKLRKHIVEVSAGKEMSYELLSQLYYLEAFLLETLRLYPPIGRIDRVATKPYTLPDTSIKIDVGDIVAIPVYGIHMDPDYYPEPGAFKPERFIKNGKVQRPSQLFLAFGAGPRNCIGVFLGRQPILYITDPEIVKAVTIRDFDHFVDRLSLESNEPRYLQRMLLNLKGGDWKAVRSSVTPAFSSSRLRYLLNLIDECGQQMVQYLRQFDNTEIEMKDVMGRFTLEVIGACAFGIKSDSLCEQNAKFLQVAENYDHMPFLKKLRVLFVLLFVPEFSKQFNISFLDEHNIAALIEMLQEAKSQRRSNTSNNKHSDFLQLILDAAEKELAEKGTQT